MLNYNECRVNVFTRFYENGKPKINGVVYTFKVDTDFIMYDKELVLSNINKVLARLSHPDCPLEYQSHEVVFFDPIDITASMRDFLESDLLERRLDAQDAEDREVGELEFRGGQ